MGLFGKKKSKSKITEAESSYSPPAADPPSADPSPSSDEDIVKVASVDIGDSESAPGIEENKSIISRVSSAVASLKSGTKNSDNSDTPYSEHEDDAESSKKSFKDEISDRVTATWAAALMFWFSLSKITQVAVVAGAGIGAVTIAAMAAAGGRAPAFPAKINVAFVGNSYFYVNDLPRFVQQIAGGHIKQDSVIHNAASILQIIMTGNGMWHKWATTKAMINGVKYEDSQGETRYLYDMGACSVPQLLTGHDQLVSYRNNLGSFIDDGQNPCFQQDSYLEHQESTNLKHSWDFVVLTDQSKNMAFEETRADALMAFNYTYGPILKKHHISPVIVQPHAYSSTGASSAGLDDIATFTALIMEGAKVYRKFINRRIGLFAKAHIAPVGNAFLAIYEESPDDIWPKLFLDDGIHPSAYGTYVYGLVIYATMTGYMPRKGRVVIDDMELSDIFSTARRLQASSSTVGFPTKAEADKMYKIVKKVAINGYKPKALRGMKVSESDGSYLRTNNDNVYTGDYTGGQQYAQTNSYYNQMYDNQANNNGYNGDDNVDYNGDDNANNNNNNNGNYNVNNGYEDYQQNYNGNGNNNYNGNDGNNNYNGNDGNNNYNGNDDNNNYNGNDGNNNYNANYQVSNGYDNYEQNFNNNENGNNGDDNDNGYYYDNNQGNNAKSYNDASQQYYEKYGQNHNNGGQNVQYGGGNQNNNQFYYADLTDDSQGN